MRSLVIRSVLIEIMTEKPARVCPNRSEVVTSSNLRITLSHQTSATVDNLTPAISVEVSAPNAIVEPHLDRMD